MRVRALVAPIRGDVTIAEYRYDGLGRRIAKMVKDGNNWDRTDYYYNDSWQCLEERYAADQGDKDTVATAVKAQYVWDIRYIDAPVLRWYDLNGDSDFADANEVLYYCNDANMNVTALVNTSGTVLERVLYDPYGKPKFYDGSWANASDTSAYANEILFCGYRRDPESGLYHIRNRMYHPTLGRWLLRDGGYWDGVHLYQYCRSMPNRMVDPFGTHCGDCCPPRDPKDNKYHVTASEPQFTPGGNTPKDIDFSSMDTGVAVIQTTDTVGGLGAGGARSVAEGGKAITGVLDSAAHVVADPAAFTGLSGAARAGVDIDRDNAIETGNWGGVSMFVRVKYKSCDPCWIWFYEMTAHETKPYRCTKGADKMLTRYQGTAVYRNKAAAMANKGDCQMDAKAAFEAGTLK